MSGTTKTIWNLCKHPEIAPFPCSSIRPAAKWEIWFVTSVGLIMFVTGIAKIISSFGHMQILHVLDPVFGMSFRSLMLGGGIIELTIAMVCFSRPGGRYTVPIITWISTVFLIYRVALGAAHWERPCPCLGTLADLIHLTPTIADTAMKLIMCYLLLGSVICLWRSRRRVYE